MIEWNVKHLAILAALAFFALGGCIFDGQAKRGSVVENEVLAGTLYTKDGEPAANAIVRAYPVDHVPNSALIKKSADSSFVYKLRTDGNGRYSAASLEEGQYNFIGEKDGEYSYLDSITVSSKSGPLPSDTLDAPGTLIGKVVLEPNHDTRRVFIQVLGTDRFANCDSSGRFVLAGLGEGDYAIRILATLDNYTPLFRGITIRAGATDTVADPIRLVFTGIPIVRGLSASYDTASATARLSWRPASYKFLKEYLVYRSDAASTIGAATLIARVRDTAYADSLALYANGLPNPGGKPRRFEYNVRIRNLSGEDGLTFDNPVVEAVPTDSVRTVLTFLREGAPGHKASVNDSVVWMVRWSNPTRRSDSLVWREGPAGKIIRFTALSRREGLDSIRIRVPATPGSFGVSVRIKDVAGSEWSGADSIQVVSDPPRVSLGKDTLMSVSDRLVLHGSILQEFGTIVKWEWNLEDGRGFIPASGPETTITAIDYPGLMHIILRVTDDDGNIGADTLVAAIVNDKPRVSLQLSPVPIESGSGYRLHASVEDRGRIAKVEWDIGNAGSLILGSGTDTVFHPGDLETSINCAVKVTDDDGNSTQVESVFPVSKWRISYSLPKPNGVAPYQEVISTSMDGKVYFAGGFDNATNIRAFYSFDPETWTFRKLPDIPEPRYSNGLSAVNGKLYMIGGTSNSHDILEFDPALMSWTRIADLPVVRQDASTVACNGKIYLFDYQTVYVFDPVTYKWSSKPHEQEGLSLNSITALSVMNGKIYQLSYKNNTRRILIYDPVSDSFSTGRQQPSEQSDIASVVADGKIWFIGEIHGKTGHRMQAYDPATDAWTEKGALAEYVFRNSSNAIGGKIYSLGYSSSIQVYDPAWEP
jgi:N-acetylneuraminic acid mutarotase